MAPAPNRQPRKESAVASCAVSFPVPFRQGLALLLPDTLISRVDGGSGDGDFFVGAKDGAQGVANLAQRGVGFDGLVDERHQVFGSFGGLAKRGEAAGDFVVRAFAA